MNFDSLKTMLKFAFKITTGCPKAYKVWIQGILTIGSIENYIVIKSVIKLFTKERRQQYWFDRSSFVFKKGYTFANWIDTFKGNNN